MLLFTGNKKLWDFGRFLPPPDFQKDASLLLLFGNYLVGSFSAFSPARLFGHAEVFGKGFAAQPVLLDSMISSGFLQLR